VLVRAEKDKRFFSDDVEYAFYLLENGKKVNEAWYTPEPSVEFLFNDDAETIEVKGFVREKRMPQKKIAVGSFLRKPVSGYRAESAVGEALGLPSQYAVFANGFGEMKLDYSELNLSPLFQNLKNGASERVIQFGGHVSAHALAGKLKECRQGSLSVIGMRSQTSSFKKGNPDVDVISETRSRWMTVHGVSNADDFDKTLATLAQGIKAPAHVLVRGQFFADMGISIAQLAPLFAHLPEGSKLYTEGLANASYRHELSAQASKYDVAVEWLYPQSTILPSEQLSPKKSPELADSLSLSDHAAPESVVGLDFSLPEERSRG